MTINCDPDFPKPTSLDELLDALSEMLNQKLNQDQRLLTLDDLVKITQLPKSWWYSQTRRTDENAVPRLKCGRYLRFEWPEVQEWLRKQSEAK